MKVPGVPPTLLGQGPQQRTASWPPPKLTTLTWGTGLLRQPDGTRVLCILSPDGQEGVQLVFDAIGWAGFAREVAAASGSNGDQ